MDSSVTNRFDPLTPLHKTVRHFMFDVTTQVGALDVTDLTASAHCVERVERLFGVLHCDNTEVKPLLKALLDADVTLRQDAAAELYRSLNRIVTNQLAAQQQLEITRTSLLWAKHTDAELRTMRYHRLAALSDGELSEMMRSMEVALNPREITAVLNDVKTNVSPKYFKYFLSTLGQLAIAPRLRQSAHEFGFADDGIPQTAQHSQDSQPLAPGRQAPRRAHRATRRGIRNR